MFKAVDFSKDAVSVMNYLDFVRIWMKDSLSLVALSSKSRRVIGAVIMRLNNSLEKSNTYSRMRVCSFLHMFLDNIQSYCKNV